LTGSSEIGRILDLPKKTEILKTLDPLKIPSTGTNQVHMDAAANVDTGEISWSLIVPGATPVPFTGFGVVVVTHASRTSK
jgi:hypothetical protein